ncbi:minor capsid protein [Gordonia sihwensis]|uniref:minor capsid protein n=1 Tax=Gordonia sihwensis TaxID=173559 RepID=UPI0024160293|nr:minor capsid protein [Gordonia sihwensis]WFN91479.1 minor capsid protein [Gordonia sihwensis]WFN91537.1 minor capsid protein [Gordonia sihwensis]
MSTPTVTRLLDSLAQYMNDAGVATFAADGIYQPTVTAPAIYFGMLHDKPDTAVAINHYDTDPDVFTHQHNPLMRVQLRWRGDRDPRTVHRIADKGFTALHTLTPGPWPGGLHPAWVQRTIVAPIETDQNGRWMRCDSYEIRLNPGVTP